MIRSTDQSTWLCVRIITKMISLFIMERTPWLSSSLEWWRLDRVRRASLCLLASRCLQRLIYKFLLEVLLGVACGSGGSFVLHPSLSDSLSWLSEPAEATRSSAIFYSLSVWLLLCCMQVCICIIHGSTLNVLYYHPNKQIFHMTAVNTYNVYQKSSWINNESNVLI